MKVLHLTGGGDTGGGKSHILGLLESLRQEVDVEIICFLDGPVYREARERGLPVELVSQKRRYDLSVLGALRRRVREGNYGLLHSHGSRSNFITALLRPLVRLPALTTIHSDYQLDFVGNAYKHLVYTSLNRWALRFFDYYIAISEDFRHMLVQRGFSPERVFTVYNGIDFRHAGQPDMTREAFLRSVGVSVPEGSLLVGTMGRLHPVKGQALLLQAAPRVLEHYPGTRFLIAGEGEEEHNLVKMARRLEIVSAVHFLGYQNQPDNFFGAIDINVLASSSESFPYVLMEGARYCLPTVATRVGGIPELIRDGEQGLLCPPGDPAALARQLIRLLGDAHLRQRLGEALYQNVRENFSTERLAASHMEIYRRILEGGGTSDGNSG